uniref:Uncharacterized protein n=1 Tax=Arundo donax TaxID=35708 RepID=A0A0A9EYR6_ARUDO
MRRRRSGWGHPPTPWRRRCSPIITSSPWPTRTGRPASTPTEPCLTCTLGKIHLVESSLFLLALKNASSLLQILGSQKMTFLSCNQSCQCVRVASLII